MRKRSVLLQVLYWMFLVGILVFEHSYLIGDIPYGLDVDEMGMGYDAWCLANFGVDRYLKSFPLYLINFSGGQSALYAYLCIPFVKIWGLSTVTMRIPSILFSMITFCFLVRSVWYVWKDTRITMLAGFLYLILPVFLLLSRIGLDCNLMLGMSSAFWFYLIRASKEQKKRDFLLTGLFGGLILYTYAVSHMVLPVFLALYLLYLLWTKRIKWSHFLCMAISLGLLAFPLIIFHLTNMFGWGDIQLGIFTLPKLYRYRSGDIYLSNVKDNVLAFWTNTLFYDWLAFDSIPKFGNMYYLSVPFLLIGLCISIYRTGKSIGKKTWTKETVFVFWFIAIYLTGILINDGGPYVYRVNSIFGIYFFFIIEGILQVINLSKRYAKVIECVMIGAYVVFYVCFIQYYFHQYTKDTNPIYLFNDTLDEALEYVEKQLPSDLSSRTTYIGGMDQTYIYFLGSKQMSPYDYNVLKDDKPYTLWLWTQEFENYRFNFPEEVDILGTYIVPKKCTDEQELLASFGFECVELKDYDIFINATAECLTPENILVSWGHGYIDEQLQRDQGDNSAISGWSFEPDMQKKWDKIYANVNGKTFLATEMEREDVAEVMQNENLKMTGFHLLIPNDDLNATDKIEIYFVDYERNQYYVEEIFYQ